MILSPELSGASLPWSSPLPAPSIPDGTAQPQGWGRRPRVKQVPHLPCNGTEKPPRRSRAGTTRRWLLSQGSHCLSWDLRGLLVHGAERDKEQGQAASFPQLVPCLPGPEQGGMGGPPSCSEGWWRRRCEAPSYSSALLAHTHSTNIC